MSMLHEPQTSLNRLEGDNTGALGLRQAPLFPRYLGEISPLFRRYRHSLFGARPVAIFGCPCLGLLTRGRGARFSRRDAGASASLVAPTTPKGPGRAEGGR